MHSVTQLVQDQYEQYPFPPLAIGCLNHVKPVPADAQFAFQYVYGCSAPANLRILDAGCGTGFSSLKLAQANPNAEIIAVDMSQASLAIAQERLSVSRLDHQVQFQQLDLQNLPDLGQFDYIHCSGVIHHVPEPHKALKHLYRSLKTDGVAYFMVYSARARHEIQMVQNILYNLWRDKTNWQEGLMLCRMFFKGLPHHHPLKRHYEHAIQVATDLLGAEAANSDAFIVDTWLQRCEHLWTVKQWLELLKQNDWFPARWLDEQAWDLRPYLPALPDYVVQLDETSKLDITNQLRPHQNLAIYVTRQSISLCESQFDQNRTPKKFNFVQTIQQDQSTCLDNGRGTRLRLSERDTLIWHQIDGQKSWHDIWTPLSDQFSEHLESQQRNFAGQLLSYQFVWHA